MRTYGQEGKGYTNQGETHFELFLESASGGHRTSAMHTSSPASLEARLALIIKGSLGSLEMHRSSISALWQKDSSVVLNLS
jgi:hypothetical protein